MVTWTGQLVVDPVPTLVNETTLPEALAVKNELSIVEMADANVLATLDEVLPLLQLAVAVLPLIVAETVPLS
jgi:hypothetical protein